MSLRRGHLVVLMGAPGAGKSTYAWRMAERTGLDVVSTDELSRPGVTREQVDAVFNGCFDRIAAILGRGGMVIFDTTAAHPGIRRRALGLARGFRASTVLVRFATPLEVCEQRRPRLDEGVVAEIWADIDGQDVSGEGWGRVLVVDASDRPVGVSV